MENKAINSYIDMLKMSINDEGIHPAPAIIVRMDGTHEMASLMLDPDGVYQAVRKLAQFDFSEIIVGLDRHNGKDQGVDEKYTSVFTFAHYSEGAWKVGVLPYTDKNNVGEVQWDNPFWTKIVTNDLKAFAFMLPESTDEVIGGAYKDKLLVTSYRQTNMGPRYEGNIDHEKLSDETREYLTKHGLDINDRTGVIKHMEDAGKPFDFIVEDHGYFTLKAGKGVFPARASLTKVYLEGVEAMINERVTANV